MSPSFPERDLSLDEGPPRFPPELSGIESGMVVEGEGLGDGSVTPSNLSMQRNVEYLKALHYWVNST
ncbi:hypothetical protein Tco_0460548, partial [Tanacetum coccineum]